MPGRPLIGITLTNDDRRAGFHALRTDYLKAVELAGGLPVALGTVEPKLLPELLSRLDGLIFSGGSDVDPELYDELPHPQLGKVVRARDDFELALLREAWKRNQPCLCICRGHQVLNVALGGTLIQDIPSDLTGSRHHDPRKERFEESHEVTLVPGTRLHQILGGHSVAVNSFHHQAIKDLAPGLVISARSTEDKIVEAVEAPDRRFVIGVQWHPESFWRQTPGFQPLFQALVEASRG